MPKALRDSAVNLSVGLLREAHCSSGSTLVSNAFKPKYVPQPSSSRLPLAHWDLHFSHAWHRLLQPLADGLIRAIVLTQHMCMGLAWA